MENKNISIFDILKNVTYEKKYLFDEYKSVYNQFIINLFLSMEPDTLYIANELNRNNLSDKMHYDFLFNVLPKRKIYFKFEKKLIQTEIEYVMKEYNVNKNIANEYLRLLPKKRLNEIIEKYENMECL